MESSTTPGYRPSGWYQDPNDPSRARYWSGSAWTDNARKDLAPQPPLPEPTKEPGDVRTLRGEFALRSCVVLGGHGHQLAAQAVCDLLFAEDRVVIKTGGVRMLDIEYSRLTNIDLGGGRTEEGGGFIGGGFGLEGFAIGAGVASLLNALTTRSSVATVIGFQWPEGELIALSRDATPDDLRIRLSRVFGLLRQRERDQTARQPDPVDQIERLGDLNERGLLTEEEFDAAKRALLAKLT